MGGTILTRKWRPALAKFKRFGRRFSELHTREIGLSRSQFTHATSRLRHNNFLTEIGLVRSNNRIFEMGGWWETKSGMDFGRFAFALPSISPSQHGPTRSHLEDCYPSSPIPSTGWPFACTSLPSCGYIIDTTLVLASNTRKALLSLGLPHPDTMRLLHQKQRKHKTLKTRTPNKKNGMRGLFKRLLVAAQ